MRTDTLLRLESQNLQGIASPVRILAPVSKNDSIRSDHFYNIQGCGVPCFFVELQLQH